MTRHATEADVEQMVDLAEMRRLQYQAYQPVFWRKAADSRDKQIPHFTNLLRRDRVIALVHEPERGRIDGFLIGELQTAPPVYDPGGLTCWVDDFMVASPSLWPTVGREILERLIAEGRKNGAVQIAVLCGHLDTPKRYLLAQSGLAIASETHVRAIADD